VVNKTNQAAQVGKAVARPNFVSRLAKGLFAVLAGLWLIAEEWLWDGMLAATAWLVRLTPVRWIESRIARLPPYAALIAFAIPAIVLLPFKLAAFWLIAKHQAALGAMLFVVAKVVGTALLARIFSLTKPALLTIGWFSRAYVTFVGWKAALYGYVKSLPAYRAIVAWKRRFKRRASELLKRLKSDW
jgi:hypothetical protein